MKHSQKKMESGGGGGGGGGTEGFLVAFITIIATITNIMATITNSIFPVAYPDNAMLWGEKPGLSMVTLNW